MSNLNWQKFYGDGIVGYFLWGLLATNDGGCLMMATRYDQSVQDGELDVFILKVDSNGLLTTVGDGPVIPVQQLAIFPNPANDRITIRYPDIFGDTDLGIIIYNSLGKEVRYAMECKTATETNINVSGLPSGLYFAVLTAGSKSLASSKFVIAR
jgi:hypothetical protein